MGRIRAGLVAAAVAASGGCGGGGAGEPDGNVLVPDADPLTTIEPGEPFRLSPGNEDGQDEDPAVVRLPDGALLAAWYSNRNDPDGAVQDKQVFVVGTRDGVEFSAPAQASAGAPWAFAPSLAADEDGVALAWWNVHLLPTGCTPGVDCTGTDNRIASSRSPDGFAWSGTDAEEITTGPGDWLPSTVGDRIYFAAVARDATGAVDLSETTSRLYYVERDTGGGWTAPSRLAALSPDGTHQSYPHVVLLADGTYAMTWTRYDAAASADPLAVLSAPSTETMFATSDDGITWSAPVIMSEGGGAFIDVFPQLFADHDGAWHLLWLTTALGGAVNVELPVGGTYPDDLVSRPELDGYTARLLATPTPDVFWGVWVSGSDPTQKLDARFFTR